MRKTMVMAGLAMFVAPQMAGASDCVALLPLPARLIYFAAQPEVARGADLKSTVTAKTKALVIAGKVNRAIARKAALEAAECLKQP